MLNWNQLHLGLEKASGRHRQLESIFNRFATDVVAQVTEEHFHIKGIGASWSIDQRFFTTNFAGRTLFFAFESVFEEDGTVVGKVTCFLKKEFPVMEHIAIGDFTFNGKGRTNLLDPDENEPIIIDSEIVALYVALHFIRESLSR